MSLKFIHDVPATRVVFGAGKLAAASEEVDRLGTSRALVISGGPEAVFADRVCADLGDRVVGRYSDVQMHVPTEIAERARAFAAECGADCLVAVGGGSAIGTAKAIALTSSLPILAIPTTYAGSEMTPIWGLTEGELKTTGRDLAVLPRTVIYDPEVTLTLPAQLSACSGMNAMAHLVEALYAPGVSPVSFLQAKEGVRALACALPVVVADPSNIEARADAQYGAWLAGWALGTSGMGVHHKICHTLGGTFNLPHAQAHTVVLPYVIAYNNEHAPTAMQAILEAFAEAGRPARSAAQAVRTLAEDIGAPTNLAEFGFTEADAPRAATLITQAQYPNPRSVDGESITELLKAAARGDTP